MKFFIALLAYAAVAGTASVSADVVLSKNIMKLAKESAILSAAAYEAEQNTTAYTELTSFIAEPDQALFVKHKGYCFGAFRGTTFTLDDWNQNFDPRHEDVCTSDDDKECCTTRQGFYDAYNTGYHENLEKALRECAEGCENKDECVVLTGHSQGGAVAAVAALYLADLNPYVFTFGQPPTIDAPCTKVVSERWYRFVNTKALNPGLTYDPIPFAPGFGSEQFGHMIILSDDDTGIAYMGLDAQDNLGMDPKGVDAHSMIGSDEAPGYITRIKNLMAKKEYPIRTTGWLNPSFCSEDKECISKKCEKETTWAYYRCQADECKEDSDCETNRCDNGACQPKLGSCMKCDEDSDCAGDWCLLGKCAGADDGLMDNNCICRIDSDCSSGRCEGLAPPTCEAKLREGNSCNEHSDCLTDYCSWRFLCAIKEPENTRGIPTGSTPKNKKKIALIVVCSVVGAALVAFIGKKISDKQRAGYEEVRNVVV